MRPGPTLIAVAAEVDPERYLRRISAAPWLFGLAVLALLAQAILAGLRARSARLDEPSEEVLDAA